MRRRWLNAVLAALTASTALAGCGRSDSADSPPADSLPSIADVRSPAPGAPLATYPPTTDAGTALRRMVAAYKSARSLQLATELQGTMVLPGAMHQRAVLRYRRDPPGLMSIVSDPVGGTQMVVGGGRGLTYYLAATNQYSTRSGERNLPALCRLMDRVAPQLVSPVLFLAGGSWPEGLGAARMTGRAPVRGRPCLVVTGRFEPAYQRALGRRNLGRDLAPAGGEYTLWLDRDRYIVLRSRVRMRWRGMAALRDADGRAIVNPLIDLTETTTEVIPNPTFGPDDFVFRPPSGAREMRMEGTSP